MECLILFVWDNNEMKRTMFKIVSKNCFLQQLEFIIISQFIISMSQDKMDHQDDPKGASRRSRKDEQGRDYVCGCGKRYLSYPALYTHIKTKHDGHQPEGTQKTGITPLSRRTKQKMDEKVLKEIQNLVHFQNLKILTQLDENALGSIAVTNRIRKQLLLNKQIFQAYNTIIKSAVPINLDKKSSLETVLFCYLIGVGQYISEPMFKYYNQFVRLFRNCFHEYAQQIYDVCFKGQDKKDKPLNLEQCKMAPIICDFFLRFYIFYENKDQDFLSVMELICFDFCQWMYINRLTIVQVTMKKVYQISRRNIIQPPSKQKKGDSDKQIEEQKQGKQESQQNHSSMNQSQTQKKQQIKQKQEEKKISGNQQMQAQQKNQKQVMSMNKT